MNKDIRTTIIHTIVKLIPPHIKPVDYLSDMLNIGKESAYRRLRGSMSFSIEELALLSQKLEFSVDELIGLKNHNKVEVDLRSPQNPEEAFLEELKKYRKEINFRLKDDYSNTITALNYLPANFSVYYENIFKFSYYTWLYHRNNDLQKLRYSDIKITPELEELRNSLAIDTRKIKKHTFILDSNVFLSPLKKVRYFYKLKLISDDELAMIKEDFYQMIDFMEKIVRTGGAEPGTRYYFYLSEINIDVNSSYSICNNNEISSINFYFFYRILIHDPELCTIHKEWLLSLKRYSTLISESDEVTQAEYFQKQREYIAALNLR